MISKLPVSRNCDMHLHEAEVLLGLLLAGDGELGDRADRRGLGGLAAGVGVDLGVHDEDIDVLARGENVVKPADRNSSPNVS